MPEIDVIRETLVDEITGAKVAVKTDPPFDQIRWENPFYPYRLRRLTTFSNGITVPHRGIRDSALLSISPTQIDPRVSIPRNGPAFYIDQDGVLRIAEADEVRADDWSSGERGILLEEEATNLIGTSDLRKFIGWTQGSTPTITQDQTIPPTATAPGSPPGEATRVQVASGGSIIKYRTAVGPVDGQHTMQVLVHNQGSEGVRVRFLGTAPARVVATNDLAPGATERVELTGTANNEDIQLAFYVFDSAHTVDILAYGPQIETGALATSFADGTRAADAPDLSAVTWASQEVTRYERRWDLATREWEEVYDVDTRTGPADLDLFKVYSAVRYEPGEVPLELMQQLAN